MSDAAAAGRAGPVSVVIPTRNRADLLAQTLRSVSEQTLSPREVVVVDDGSTDATDAVVARYGARHIRNAAGDWGPARARNAGLEQVRTPYVSFVDSDDLLRPTALSVLLDALERAPDASFSYGAALSARLEGEWRPEFLIATSRREALTPLCSLYARNPVPASGALVRADAARSVGGYDPGFVFAEDHHFWIRLAQLAPPRYVPSLVSVYRLHSSGRHDPDAAGAYNLALLELAESDRRLRSCIPERLGVELCRQGLNALREGRPDKLPRVARATLLGQGSKAAILRRSVRNLRMGRTLRDRATQLWERDGDLRGWLATY